MRPGFFKINAISTFSEYFRLPVGLMIQVMELPGVQLRQDHQMEEVLMLVQLKEQIRQFLLD